jgi:hypothetical protein
MRKTYSGKVVSNFGKHILDANIRPEYNCNCSTSSVGIFRAVRRLQCALFSWFCIAKSKVAAWWSFLIYRKVPVPRPFNDSNLLPPERQIAVALRVRTLVPMATAVDHSHPLLPDAEWEVTLESIGLVGMYRALVVAVRGDQVRMLTNFTLRPSGPPYLSAPGATLAASQGQSQSLADDIRARLSQLQFSEGGGGSTTAADGAVTFLTIRHGSQERKTALYFYHFPASANHWRRPDGVDGERWDAINTVYEIWRDVVSSPAVNPSPTSMPET